MGACGIKVQRAGGAVMPCGLGLPCPRHGWRGGPVEYTAPEPNAALVVGPNDHLVIALPADVERNVVDHFIAEFRVHGLAERVTIVAGVESIAVLRDAGSRACADCLAESPEQFAAFPTVCEHRVADGADT